MGVRDLSSHWVMHSLCAVSLQGDGCGRPIYWFCVVVSFLCRVDWCERPIKSFVLFFLVCVIFVLFWCFIRGMSKVDGSERPLGALGCSFISV